MQYQSPLHSQHNQHSKCEIEPYKKQIKRLAEKLSQYEKRLLQYQKQEQKMKELQKSNEQNSTRILQCVSNIRDLLHSNKTLRKELNQEKRLNQVHSQEIQKLKLELHEQRNMSHHPIKNKNFQNQQSSLHELRTDKRLKLLKLQKIQKLSKLNSITQKRNSLINLEPQPFSPTTQKNKIRHRMITDSYRSTSFVGKQQQNLGSRKNIKLCKSIQMEKKQTKKYLRAKLRRKKSLFESEQRMEMLQHKPFIDE